MQGLRLYGIESDLGEQPTRVRSHPFGFAALGVRGIKHWPRALLKLSGVFSFGLNMYGVTSAPL